MKKIFLFILILYKGITFSSYHIKQNNNLNNTDILELNGDYSNYSLLNSKKIFDADGNFTLNNLYNLCKLYQDNIVIFLIIFLSLLLILIIQINLHKQLKKCERFEWGMEFIVSLLSLRINSLVNIYGSLLFESCSLNQLL